MVAGRACIAFLWLCSFTLAACREPSDSAVLVQQSFAAGGVEPQHTVVVNPKAHGKAIAATIQDAIEMVEPGGKVQVKPGTYSELIVIDKGLTLEAIGDGRDPVIIATPPGLPDATVQIATPDPVTIRDLTVL